MKLLFDENLSPRLPKAVADVFPGSAHVHDLGLGAADDLAIWEAAKQGGFAIVSRDADYNDLSVLRGNPPKLIWIRHGNCSTGEIEDMLRRHAEAMRSFLATEDLAVLMLY